MIYTIEDFPTGGTFYTSEADYTYAGGCIFV